jgi:hypothetical protein
VFILETLSADRYVCEEPLPTCDLCDEPQHLDGGPWHPDDWNGDTGCHLTCEQAVAALRLD